MSTFSGIVSEIPNISIDRFDGVNLMSTAFFLSHCHSDHMHGLFAKEFLNRLEEENIFLYCSEISYHILMNTDIKNVKESVKIVSYRMEEMIEVPPSELCSQSQSITVTVIPAGHCPGSVMFLFESVGRILYTGDIRIVEGDIRKMKQFINCEGSVKKIDTLYLDTTFLDLSYKYFPQRKASADSLCKLIEEWINQSAEHYVHIITSARHGSEYLFNEIFKNLKMQVHVDFDHFDLYRNVPEVESSMTASSGLTQIHACGMFGKKPCQFLSAKERHLKRVIKPSALWFHNRQDTDSIKKDKYGGINFSVAYSCHSSFNELVDIIDFLKPKKIVPCVIPPRRTDEIVKKLLRSIQGSFVSECNSAVNVEHKKQFSNSEFKRLLSEQRTIVNNASEISEDDLSSPSQKVSRFE